MLKVEEVFKLTTSIRYIIKHNPYWHEKYMCGGMPFKYDGSYIEDETRLYSIELKLNDYDKLDFFTIKFYKKYIHDLDEIKEYEYRGGCCNCNDISLRSMYAKEYTEHIIGVEQLPIDIITEEGFEYFKNRLKIIIKDYKAKKLKEDKKLYNKLKRRFGRNT